MSVIRRRYSKAEKLEIVHQSMEDHVNLEKLGKQYGVHPNTISGWRKQYGSYQSNSFPGHGNKLMTDQEKEIYQLKKKIKEVELEKEILKKALGIISSVDRKNLLS